MEKVEENIRQNIINEGRGKDTSVKRALRRKKLNKREKSKKLLNVGMLF